MLMISIDALMSAGIAEGEVIKHNLQPNRGVEHPAAEHPDAMPPDRT